jgi:hypothetical protein
VDAIHIKGVLKYFEGAWVHRCLSTRIIIAFDRSNDRQYEAPSLAYDFFSLIGREHQSLTMIFDTIQEVESKQQVSINL